MARPAAGGGHWVDIAPERLTGWLDRFAKRHGELDSTREGDVVLVRADDGSLAEIHVPFGPLEISGGLLTSVAAHARVDRTIGVLLVRLGGFAAGVFHGSELLVSKCDSRLVHARHKNGGSSQARFARRREGQARVALNAAADVAARILVPRAKEMRALVAGGDRNAIDLVLADRRLESLRPLVTDRFLAVPEPRRAILDATPDQFRSVQIRILEPRP